MDDQANRLHLHFWLDSFLLCMLPCYSCLA